MLVRHAGLDPASRDPRKHWIPAFAGMTIFLHAWKDGGPTLGCVSMPEEMVLKILGWLDPAKKPLIIMGTESELRAIRSR